MRFFIALEIPSENRLQFQAIQDKLSKLIPQAKITNLDKIHLTLAFLGEQQDQLKDGLTEIIRNSADGVPSFEVTPAYIDGFPNLHHPQVLWVGVKGDIDKVLLIRERVKDGLENLHLPVDERRFVPHITIAKLKESIKVDQALEIELEKLMTLPFDSIKITSIKLFESVPNEGHSTLRDEPSGSDSKSFHTHNTLAEIILSENGV
ncbi:RNA 2',3'-cyclic phosphodiesterase [Candidatus Daviesbacteria bacterium]|nr:RNA 2',3'-cyclic phosphodiesterase [Candidatus Daviesbacteria bacterium]